MCCSIQMALAGHVSILPLLLTYLTSTADVLLHAGKLARNEAIAQLRLSMEEQYNAERSAIADGESSASDDASSTTISTSSTEAPSGFSKSFWASAQCPVLSVQAAPAVTHHLMYFNVCCMSCQNFLNAKGLQACGMSDGFLRHVECREYLQAWTEREKQRARKFAL